MIEKELKFFNNLQTKTDVKLKFIISTYCYVRYIMIRSIMMSS